MNLKPPGNREIAHFLNQAGSELGLSFDNARTFPLAGDGSERRFYRVRNGSSHYVALFSPRRNWGAIDENDSYYLIGKHLDRLGIPVPRFYWADLENGFFLLEDVGDWHLQRFVNRGFVDLDALYGRVLRLLLALHQRTPAGFNPEFCFDTTCYDASFVYDRELEYFRKAFLVGCLKLDVSPEDLRHDFENLAEAAGTHEPSMVIHRDFQSRNIMVHRGALRLLDFQGMRFGPPAYDLASILVDPYVALSRPLQEGLLYLYWSGVRKYLKTSYDRFIGSYHAVRLCRNLQILGAYGFLGVEKGKTNFFRYVPRAWRQLCLWVNGPCKNRYPTLQKRINLIDGSVTVRGRNHNPPSKAAPESFA